MGFMVSLWYDPSPVRDHEFLIQRLPLEKNRRPIAQHTTHEALFVLFALIQKLHPTVLAHKQFSSPKAIDCVHQQLERVDVMFTVGHRLVELKGQGWRCWG
jgi:hypothetical protein